MNNSKNLARYLINSYEKQTGNRFDNNELKLQKLMYLCQRESILLTGEPIIEENFQGWKLGPVLTSLRHFFEYSYDPDCNIDELLSDEEKYIADNVIVQYGKFEPWYLVELTHNESSWKNSRKGLSDDDEGNQILSIEDIREDAKKLRIYDNLFDMYVDEFDDADEEMNGWGRLNIYS